MQTFARTDFTFGEPFITDVSGVSAKVVSFSTPLVNDVATLKITTYVFLESGTIEPTRDEAFSVVSGSVKFNIEVLYH